MQFIYDDLFSAVLGATRTYPERSDALFTTPAGHTRTERDDGTETYVVCTHDFTFIVRSNTQGKWGYSWVWTDVVKK
ncbi:hypothetical protein [Cupriavidus necator]